MLTPIKKPSARAASRPLIGALQLQVRRIEEPYLLAIDRDVLRRYA